ncbi:MAG: hypothetical protein P9M01_01460 [Candidatus Kappaea frigidicola]|nr:hypothetical protein [Candidatus Kappaea frigidicola]
MKKNKIAREYIENYLRTLRQGEKNSLLKKYFDYSKRVIKQNKVSEENIQIIKNCLLINVNLSDSEIIRDEAFSLYRSL